MLESRRCSKPCREPSPRLQTTHVSSSSLCPLLVYLLQLPFLVTIVTTIRPQLGAVCYEDGRRLTVADLPGLIEGAHLNVGMGHYFLKHVERTKLLLVIVDVQGFVLNDHSAFRNAFETVILLNKVGIVGSLVV